MFNLFSTIEHSFQKIIDKLRGKPDIPALSEYISTLAGLVKRPKDLNTVIFGSSHFKFGYLPQEHQYNIAMASQDLYYSYQFYKKYANGVKNVVLGYSYFSPYHVLVKCKFADLAMVVKIIEGIDYQYPESAQKKELDKLEKRCKNYILKSFKRKVKSFPENNIGFLTSYKGYYEPPSQEFINTARKTFKREHVQICYLKKIIEETCNNNQNLLIVCPPMSDDFIHNFKEETDKNISEMYDIVKDYPKVRVANYFCDKDFSNADFEDMEHLSYNGAEKLTQKIQEELKKFN